LHPLLLAGFAGALRKPTQELPNLAVARALLFHFRFVRKRTRAASNHPDFDLLIGSVQRPTSAATLRLDEKMSTPAP
jgi:hypothetical protein